MPERQDEAAELIRLFAELRHRLVVFQHELEDNGSALLLLAAVNLEHALTALDLAFKRLRSAAHLISKS